MIARIRSRRKARSVAAACFTPASAVRRNDEVVAAPAAPPGRSSDVPPHRAFDQQLSASTIRTTTNSNEIAPADLGGTVTAYDVVRSVDDAASGESVLGGAPFGGGGVARGRKRRPAGPEG